MQQSAVSHWHAIICVAQTADVSCFCNVPWCTGSIAMQAEGADHKHDESVTSVGFEVAGECSFKRLNKWLSNLMMTKGVDLFRSKGILSIQGSGDKYAPADA